ncbi:MAG: NAD-dependent epimerase/dehydratase family protein [Deltaproteobacteria bacterium]|nr:NAD-dependent epimerase/dehydratase family protein [Deltaproteobacteria bacterium]
MRSSEAVCNTTYDSQRGTNTPDGRSRKQIRAAIVGAGYIADFHARAIGQVGGVELVAVCDPNLKSARNFAARWGVSKSFDSLESMFMSEKLDSVHVLAPPDAHYPLASNALSLGANVLLEKPMCVSTEEADELVRLSHRQGLYLGVSHNLLFSIAYRRLREMVRSGVLGPLDHVIINYFAELGQIRSGPFDSWMLREPSNPLLETGPHVISALLDLVGTPDQVIATADRPVDLPGGTHVFSRWRVRGAVGRTAVDLNINQGPGFRQRVIHVRGLIGSATADFDANTCVVDRGTPLDIDLDRYRRTSSIAAQLRSHARQTLSEYALTKLKLRKRGNPFEVTFLDSVAAFYDKIRSGTELDSRMGSRLGCEVIRCCRQIVRAAGVKTETLQASRLRVTPVLQPTVLVFGATGFIGRELVRQLLAGGYCVRAAVRGSGAVLATLDNGNLEIVPIDIASKASLRSAMEGIDHVYHLARVNAKTWGEYLERDVEPTRLIAESCLLAKVKRLIYTSTIDSYYAGSRAGVITEQTPLDPRISRRNYYARAKAAAEAILIKMHAEEKLPVVIFRPGIVIGRGGDPFHWGVGMWASPGVCQVWGEGRNKLPLVLVADVATALVRGIQVEGIEGRSYNLVDEPLLTARDYLSQLQRMAAMTLTVQYRPIWQFYAADIAKWLVKLAVRHPDRFRIPSYGDWDSRTQKASFDAARARDELNWTPASNRQRLLDEGIGGSLQSWLPASTQTSTTIAATVDSPA